MKNFSWLLVTFLMGSCAKEEKSMKALIEAELTEVADFPKKGIIFQDMSPILKNPEVFRKMIDHWAQQYQHLGIDYIAGLEARGFILGSALAFYMNKPFIPVRKKGKLPRPKYSQSYQTEYSEDTIEIADDVLGATVLVVDDLLATGGTLKAAEQLFKRAGAKKIYSSCLIELKNLHGRDQLESFSSIVQY